MNIPYNKRKRNFDVLSSIASIPLCNHVSLMLTSSDYAVKSMYRELEMIRCIMCDVVAPIHKVILHRVYEIKNTLVYVIHVVQM